MLGYTTSFGARPLKRAIQNLIENEIAKKLLVGEFVPDDHMYISVVDNALVFSKNEITLQMLEEYRYQ